MIQPPILTTPDISVVMTTYNQPDWLELVLWGFAYQQLPDNITFELLVADDGSSEETRELIQRMQPLVPYNLKHIWHENDGFRKCEILNKAFVQMRGDYVIVTDGDCIPRADFLLAHYTHRDPSRFLSGGAIRLPMSISKAITPELIRTGDCFKKDILNSLVPRVRIKSLKLTTRKWLAQVMNLMSTVGRTWNGNNSSCYREALLAVNGMDERMKYGGLDRELGERLTNYGLKGKRVRYLAIMLHLDHKRGYVTKESWAFNHHLRKHTRNTGVIQTPHGIKKEM